jgi:DNA-binding NtrC family response regulator
MNVLVVEDDPAQRRAYEELLLQSGHRMCWAATVRAAEELLKTEEIDLVLLDFQLADGTPGTVIANQVARRIPVFMISGHSEEDMKAKVSNTLEGITVFFQKPVDDDKLLEWIDRVERTSGKL